MKVCERYDSPGDAQMQLASTFVELDGDLCFLRHYDEWEYDIIWAEETDEGPRWSRAEREEILDQDLNLQPFPLGYVNSKNMAFYLQRKPLRKWKQGTYAGYLDIAGGYTMSERDIQQMMLSPDFIRAYRNEYPTLARAYYDLVVNNTEQYVSTAFHREWALGLDDNAPYPHRSCLLLYKGNQVGRTVGSKIHLDAEYKYLAEALLEAIVHAS